MDARVQAIREHKLVGRGSCTTIDECWTNEELVRELEAANIKTADAAIQFALECEGLHREMALNARWGEDDDPQLKEWQKWQRAVADLD